MLNDSGAGRCIESRRALLAQGVPEAVLDAHTGTASETVSFDTCGGEQISNEAVGFASDALGNSREFFILPDAPLAACMGQTVIGKGQPFIWNPPDLPYHVTDASKLHISCPEKFRRYAHKVENNVPIFRERVTISAPAAAPIAV